MKSRFQFIKKSILSTPLAFLWNTLLIYLIYGVCRIEYVLENRAPFAQILSNNSLKDLLTGSWYFDTSAIFYTNALYALMMLIPLHYKEKDWWQKVCKWTFIIINSLCIAINLADSVYFNYTGRRTTATVFSEFSNENNLGSIFGAELVNHWYLVVLGIALIASLCFLYQTPKGELKLMGGRDYVVYYPLHIILFVLYIPLTIGAMRGGFATSVRPIAVSNANQYVSKPLEAAVVLNTTFSIIRTTDTKTFADPQYFCKEELDSIYSPIHQAPDSIITKRKNVVVLIVESFGREYIGKYNEHLEGGNYKGYTPFTDSLYSQSLSFDYTFSNGRKSIDGMPSILSSIPMFVEPFFITPAAMNDVSGIAGELSKAGYYTAFFHGAENGSMGFQAFARATGFKDYFGRTEFEDDKRFGGEQEFDGTWAIWDEPFLQFYATKMSEMKEPFMTAVFTASSHHPFKTPTPPASEGATGTKDRYQWLEKNLVEDKNPIHKCIRYTDYALQKFFEYASRQPWYKNTLFVMTSDHTNLSDHAEYQTDLGVFGAPILIFDPSGDIKAERRHCIAQQIDIMPTVLSALGYKGRYVGFGCDLLTTPDEDTWAVNYDNGIFQYIKGEYVIQFDGEILKGMYNFHNDILLKKNLLGTGIPEQKQMERELKAIIQSYMQRMVENKLIVR